MYEIDICAQDAKDVVSRDALGEEMHFDLSYIHSMWYLCRRCRYIRQMFKTEYIQNEKPFIEIVDDVAIIRPCRISQCYDVLKRSEDMKDCIKVWFSPKIHIMFSQIENIGYHYSLYFDFCGFLKTTQSSPRMLEIYEEVNLCQTMQIRLI
ncbi:hypothetical protein NEMIN01_0410 [Nematocida minor]|uniref:uncharacterized protein n=1 Tax=Nematocida minor TaxID=1912983 RepID=UPI0022208F44|nr:uncharacterized protein NEMIN01_0410 [Nematocida minor]KAI5189244.1 hypothetical protein NEMIN01_0410 [Nematocida minor]